MKHKVTNFRKRNDLLGYTILIFMAISTFFIHQQLSTLQKEIEDVVTIPKIKITDANQFKKMCTQFTEQWGGAHFAFYILQPNSTFKTHKEKSILSSDIKNLLPNRTPITSSVLDQYLVEGGEYANVTKEGLDRLLMGHTMSGEYDTVVIPVRQNDVIIGELYIFYDASTNIDAIDAHVSEAQLLTQLLY